MFFWAYFCGVNLWKCWQVGFCLNRLLRPLTWDAQQGMSDVSFQVYNAPFARRTSSLAHAHLTRPRAAGVWKFVKNGFVDFKKVVRQAKHSDDGQERGVSRGFQSL